MVEKKASAARAMTNAKCTEECATAGERTRARVGDKKKWSQKAKWRAFYPRRSDHRFPRWLFILLVNENRMTTLLLALSVVTGQFLVAYFFPVVEGYPGFLLFILILGRFLGVYHPETEDDQPLGTGRIVLGWLALLIFVLCFSPKSFVFS